MLRLEGVRAGYGTVGVLNDVTLHVDAGEVVTMIGCNGAGKSTTLKCVSGLIRAGAGRIVFEDRDITRAPEHEIVAMGLVQVPEGRRVFPKMTVAENLDLGAYTRRDTAGIRADLDRVFALFPVLAERRRQTAGTLSGGEQQMLAVGRGLMAKPRLLLLDEPSLGLAPLIVAQIFRVIAELAASGVTILLVEQNAQAALHLAQRGYVMETGRITLAGPSAQLLADENVRTAYLGGG
ncbi:MAG: ABC transporter ATP-binding protein [Deltaproteobacteria bacterium]|nr:ABC transporter ATP-binding protein [Deltaproteobacteria bacterium]